MIKYLRIDHIALHVSDIQKSKKFYEEYFGFETYFEHETPTGMPISYLKLGETVLELTGFSDPPASGFHFAWKLIGLMMQSIFSQTLASGFTEASQDCCQTSARGKLAEWFLKAQTLSR